jgi:integrase/recombinase XerC
MNELQDLCAKWLQYLSCGLSRSENTCVSYGSDFVCFLDFFKKYTDNKITLQKIIAIEPRDWRAWMCQQKNDGISARTISRRLCALKSFFKFLAKSRYIQTHPIFDAATQRIPKSLPRPVSYQDITELIDTCSFLHGAPWIHARDEAIIFLLYSVGLRINEAMRLDYCDIIDNEFLTIVGKGGKIRQVPFMPEVKCKIESYKKLCPYTFNRNGPLFFGSQGKRLLAQVFEHRIRTIRRLLSMPETLTPHTLRHSCATHLMTESEDLRGIQELLGHASLSTTQIYTAINSKVLKSAYDNAHPRSKKQ